LRIAYASDCYWPRVNGVSTTLQTYRDELTRLGHEVLILCPHYPSTGPSSARERCVKRLASRSTPLSKEDRLVKPTALPAMFRALDRFKPDVIHLNTEFTVTWMGFLYSKLRGYPVLMTSHTDWEDYICNYIPFFNRGMLRASVRFLMRAIFLKADILITPSESQSRMLRGYHIRKRNIVIPSGVPSLFSKRRADEANGYRRALESKYPALAGKQILLFSGRIADEKDPKFLIPVLADLLEKRDDIALVFAGDGPGRRHVESAARRRGIIGSCVFLGYIDRSELALLYSSASVFVFPSKTETLGLCTIEAMASGLPVVAIGEKGTRDVMQGDHGGFMVPDDRRAFADAVLRLLEDPALRESKSAEAVAWARRFAVETTTLRLVRLYRVLSKRRSRILRIRSGIR
jgi:1,2-diacylglycerol 3-alpha-glucosyltransferase